jgi:cytochrome c biogenesis protein CcmG/thiol:disulfide interchange protein DsbE
MKQLMIAFVVVGMLWGITYYVQQMSSPMQTESEQAFGLTSGQNNEGDKKPESDNDAENSPASTSVASLTEVSPKVGFKAPDFELIGMDKKTYSLSQLAGEKPVMINFWASWCGPCRYETPDIVELHEKYKDDVVFYGLNLTSTDKVESVEAFIKEFNVNYPILLDITGDVSSEYAIQAVPTTFFIDKNGMVVDKIIGAVSGKEIERRIQKIIGS